MSAAPQLRRLAAISASTVTAIVATLALLPLSACASSSSTSSAPALPAGPLRWAPPALDNPTTVAITQTSRHNPKLDPSKDYIVKLPDTPLSVNGGIQIIGGHNVVLIGGEINIPQTDSTDWKSRRALYLNGQTGTVHVEGVRMTGDLGEGIDIMAPDATVQLENNYIDPIAARDEVNYSDTHPDLIQAWAGPHVLRVDRFTGTTDYQGFFLDPNQLGMDESPGAWSFSNVDLHHTPHGGGYIVWLGRRCNPVVDCAALKPAQVSLDNFWLDHNRGPGTWQDPYAWNPNTTSGPRTLAVGDTVWASANWGSPRGGNFVPRSSVGVGYRTLGYREGTGSGSGSGASGSSSTSTSGSGSASTTPPANTTTVTVGTRPTPPTIGTTTAHGTAPVTSGVGSTAQTATPVPRARPKVAVRKARLANALSRGLEVDVTSQARVSATVRMVVDAETARGLGLGSKAATVGSGAAVLPRAGEGRIRVRFTSALARKLRGTKSVKLLVEVHATDGTGRQTDSTASVLLRR